MFLSTMSESLSTVKSIAQALTQLEDNKSYDQLLKPFNVNFNKIKTRLDSFQNPGYLPVHIAQFFRNTDLRA